MQGRSLRARLVLLVLVPSIPLLAITAYVANELRERDIASARAELAAFASLVASDLQDSAEETRHLLEAVARIPAVANADVAECTRIFGVMVQSAPRYGVLVRTDAEGQGVCHSASHGRLASYGDRAYFANLRRSGQFFAGKAVVGRITGKPLFVTALAVRDDSGEFVGALMSGLDLRWFGDNLVRRLPYPRLSLTIWAPDGTILYRHPDADAFIGKKAEGTGIGAAVVGRSSSTSYVEVADVRGQPTLYAIRGIEDWSGDRTTITVGASSADLVANADAIFQRSMISFGVIFAIALATALLMGEYGIRRRTLAVTRASSRIAAGDLAARTGVAPSQDELGQLADSFDRMAGALESTSVSLHMLSEAGKSLVRASDEVSLLQDICRIVVEQGGYLSCYAGRAEPDAARTLRAIAGSGFAAGYLESLDLTWADRGMGKGPSGIAIRTQAPVAVRDMHADSADGEWRTRMLARGYGSFVALPIRTRDGIFGALGVSAREPGRFGEAEVARLMELADDLGFGIQALRNRDALDRHAQELEVLVAERTAQLQSANRFLDSVIENIPDMVFVKRASDLRFVRLNRAGESLVGVSRDALIGKSDHDLFPASQAEFFVARDREALASAGMVEIPEEPLETPAGTRILHTKKIPIADDDGRPAYLLGISRDITSQREHEREMLALNAKLAKRAAELDSANRELEAFSYSVSHDLRAPLRHVQGYVELLSAAAGDRLSDKARRYLSVISDSAREMGTLIDDLLMFSRTARTEMRRSPVDMDALVADSLKALEMAAEGRRIEWRIGSLPRVMGDAPLLRQVWANVLGNAVKYTRGREVGVIEVDGHGGPNAMAVFRVRDNGVGFDMKHAAKLFGVFQRLHRADEFEGTGIGLAIVQRVIARHGGRIWAEAAPGKGATFYFTLQPAADDSGPAPTEAP